MHGSHFFRRKLLRQARFFRLCFVDTFGRNGHVCQDGHPFALDFYQPFANRQSSRLALRHRIQHVFSAEHVAVEKERRGNQMNEDRDDFQQPASAEALAIRDIQLLPLSPS